MSTLRTNALEGMDAKNSITIVAGAGNITTTNVQEGLCKAWCRFDGTSSGFQDSFNMGSLTDHGTGDHEVAYTNNMANTSYSTIGSAKESTGETHSSAGADRLLNPSRLALVTSGVKVTAISLANAQRDCDENAAQICGDLA